MKKLTCITILGIIGILIIINLNTSTSPSYSTLPWPKELVPGMTLDGINNITRIDTTTRGSVTCTLDSTVFNCDGFTIVDCVLEFDYHNKLETMYLYLEEDIYAKNEFGLRIQDILEQKYGKSGKTEFGERYKKEFSNYSVTLLSGIQTTAFIFGAVIKYDATFTSEEQNQKTRQKFKDMENKYGELDF